MRSVECGIRKETKNQSVSDDKQLSRAKSTAYRLLTIRPRSGSEIKKKLEDRGFDSDVVNAVFTNLVRFGYVNDREFARQWADARIRLRGFGRRRIEQELRGKGIGRDIIAEALAGLLDNETELKTAQETARKKLKTFHSVDRETRRRRLAGFLERKGFSYDVIRTVLTETVDGGRQH